MTRELRGSAALALGSVASGLLAYVLFVLVTRGLGATAAAPVTVLWTVWAFTGAALTFPLQHWVTRSVGAGLEGDVRRAASRVAVLVVVAALVLGGVAWLLRDRLFHRDDTWFPAFVVLMTLGSAAVGVARGGLGGRGRFAAVAWSLVAENGLRCLLVAALLLAGVHDPVAHGLCLVAGSVVASWRAAWRFAGGDHSESSAFAFLGGSAGAQVAGQAVLTGGPVLLALTGGSAHEVTTMFAALALFRAPYMVVLGLSPQLNLHVTRHATAGNVVALRSLARRLAVLTAAGVGAAGLLGALLGPSVLRLVFGGTVDLSAGLAATLATGCALGIANLALTVGVLALGRASAAAGAWASAVLGGATAVVALGGLSPSATSAGAFLVAEVAATLALALLAVRSRRDRSLSRA